MKKTILMTLLLVSASAGAWQVSEDTYNVDPYNSYDTTGSYGSTGDLSPEESYDTTGSYGSTGDTTPDDYYDTHGNYGERK